VKELNSTFDNTEYFTGLLRENTKKEKGKKEKETKLKICTTE
jgi:hypothetical protein